MVSPLLLGSPIDHTLYDHTSIIRAVMERFGVTGELGLRVAGANPIAPVFAAAPRSDVPDLSAPAVANDTVAGDLPLTHIQVSLVLAAARRLSELSPLCDSGRTPTELAPALGSRVAESRGCSGPARFARALTAQDLPHRSRSGTIGPRCLCGPLAKIESVCRIGKRRR